MLIREFHKTLQKRLSEKYPLIQILLGPRQVGKTTLVKELIKKDIRGCPSMPSKQHRRYSHQMLVNYLKLFLQCVFY